MMAGASYAGARAGPTSGGGAPRLHEVVAREADVPADAGWLTDTELQLLVAFRIPKRRDDWRLGRWAAKRAVAAALGRPTGAARRGISAATLGRIEILRAEDGAPEARVEDVEAPGRALALSISHSHGTAFAAAAVGSGALGVDIEAVEPRSDRFVADYFTADEAARVRAASAADRPLLANLTWAAKEAALKALRTGLRLDTRAVVVERIGAAEFTVRMPGGACWDGSWCEADGLVRTILWAPVSASRAADAGEAQDKAWPSRSAPDGRWSIVDDRSHRSPTAPELA